MHIGPSRRTSLTALVVAVLLSVAGCGGGGSDTATAPPTPVSPAPPTAEVEPASVISVPPPAYSDVNRKAAFDRLNEVRRLAGLGVLAQSTALDQAAQAHSGYLAVDGDTGHDEVPGHVGFTGVTASDRAITAGYSLGDLYEVVAGGHSVLGGRGMVDLLMGGPYHRMGMLLYHSVDMGVVLLKTQTSLELCRSRLVEGLQRCRVLLLRSL